MRNATKSWLAVMITCAACTAETAPPTSSPLPVSTPTITSPATTAMTGLGAAGSAPSAPATTPAAAAMPAASATPKGPSPEGTVPPPPTPTPAAPAPATPPATPPIVPGASMSPPPPASAGSGGGTAAEKFCDKYGEHCGYAMANRHADRAACIANFNATPAQQGCKTMHIDTAIAGTAAACNGMPSAFCFSIHCLHAAGITDPTGVTYCK